MVKYSLPVGLEPFKFQNIKVAVIVRSIKMQSPVMFGSKYLTTPREKEKNIQLPPLNGVQLCIKTLLNKPANIVTSVNTETIPAQQKENGTTAPLPVGRRNSASHGGSRANGMLRNAIGEAR